MWKDTDIYCKRDDDSAIGDSENNSAEEESMNFRRKSSVSDDIDEMAVDSHLNLEKKLGAKIPNSLLKNCDETLVNCQKFSKNKTGTKSKSKREIIVLPNAAAAASFTKKSNSETNKIIVKDHSLLEAKLKFLLCEMKQLRELDRDIFRKFVELNENVEEVRWKLEEEEEHFRKKLEEEAEEEEVRRKLDEDYFPALNNTNLHQKSPNRDNRVDESSNGSYDVISASYRATVLAEHIKRNDESKLSFNQPKDYRKEISSASDLPPTYNLTHAHVSHHVVSDSRTNGYSDARRPVSTDRMSEDDVWVVREEYKSTRSQSRKQSIPLAPQQVSQQSAPPISSKISRRHSEVTRTKPKIRSQTSASAFKLVADEHSRIGRLTPWAVSEANKNKTSMKTPSFNQPHPVNISYSRSRGSNNVASNIITKASDSNNSLNSSSSRTSSETSLSPTVPTQNHVKGNNSTRKWSRFLRRSSKAALSSSEKNDVIMTNNNYKIGSVTSNPIEDPVLQSGNIVPVSYKRTSPASSRKWTHHKDDITFL